MYYGKMTQAFNDLANAGPWHELNKSQKVIKFELGQRDSNAIKYHIGAKLEWDQVPNPKTSNDFYNLFSKRLSQYRTMISGITLHDNQRSRISATFT